MSERAEWKVEVGDETVSAVYESATNGPDQALFLMAHGAGGNMSDRAMLAAANALRARGFGVVRFNFVYSEKHSGRPDPMPKCMAVIAAVGAGLSSAAFLRHLPPAEFLCGTVLLSALAGCAVALVVVNDVAGGELHARHSALDV